MLPRIISVKGVTLGLLVLCLCSEFVTAGSLRSNILAKAAKDCVSCNSIKACALRQFEQKKCPSRGADGNGDGNGDGHGHGRGDEGSCMTIYNAAGLVKQRGCSATLSERFRDYCVDNPARCITCDKDNCNADVTAFKPKTKQTNDIDIDNDNDKGSDTNRAGDNVHECYRCRNGDCEDLEVVTCNGDSSDKRCYIQFKIPIDTSAMGCISDFANEQEIISLIKQKLLYICDGDKCNGYENFPQPNQCSLCSSENAETCATLPSMITDEVNCNMQPYTQCYQRVNNKTNGLTERGCLSSLEGDEFWNCLISNNKGDCKICTGNACNREIVPSNRRKCHRCDSTKDAKCEESPASLSVCPIYNADEKCVSTFESGVTKRGCSSNLECDSRSRFCEKCNGDGCNLVNLRKRSEEIYGIFQELPLNCYTCKGDECESDVGLVRKCEGSEYQDCLTVFDEKGKVIERGCEKIVNEHDKSYCDKHPELCFNCKSNGCNTMTDFKKFQECLYCDSAVNPDCLFKPETIKTKRKCVQGCIASLYPRKTNPNVHDFVRTCYEDIEEDDRPECTAESNCVRCTDKSNCNTDILPEYRLSCLHCNGMDCNSPQSKMCSGYSLEDQCYIFFSDVNYSALQMGCLSDLRPRQVDTHVKQYFLCDGNDCNNYGNLPNATVCMTCNSANDVNCAVNPSNITSKARCQTYPYTECVSRINRDGHTERGCFYNMATEDFIKCRDGDPDEICKLCTETGCNEAVYPSRRRQCFRCNSLTDGNCESDPRDPLPCPIYKADDGCVTKLIKGVTHRGCLSEFTCDDSNRRDCRECKDNNCNTVDLSAVSIGDPGLFQTLPLNCYHCNGTEECSSDSWGVVRKCEGNELQTCTVTFNSLGNVVARGCSDSIEPVCDQIGNMCYDCKSNGCNVARKDTDYIDCVFCNAQDDEGRCIFEVDKVTRRRRCHKGCMTALYPRTHDEEPVYELIRTCLDDLDLDDRELCENGKDGNCKPCKESACNIDLLGERKSCYHCKGDNCQAPEKRTCRATMKHDQCFIEYDESGSAVEMGCKSKFDPQDVRTLLSAKRLWLCDEDDCNVVDNVPSPQRCAVCSSRTDAKCATAPTELTTDTGCNRKPFTQCYMRVLEGGYTERGCLSNLEGEEFLNCLSGANETACMACIGENCNKKLHPADRRSCHICSSSSSENCERSPASEQVCPKYSADEHCISLIDANGNTMRGCSSQLACDITDTANCRTCDGDNCNRSNLKRKADANPGMWQDLPLKCHVCNSVADCAAGAKEDVCEQNDYCVTVFSKSGAVEARGCSTSVESKFGSYCDESSENCHNCNSNNCNTATSMDSYTECIYCDSETSADCVFKPESVRYRRMCNGACMTALYPKPNTDDAFGLLRSCVDDKDEADRKVCIDGDESCIACEGKACNSKDFPDDRWSCHTCNGDDCEEAEPQKCKIYRKNEQCFILFSQANNSILSMGCVSDLDESFMAGNIDSLFMCSEGRNCNNYDNMPQPNRCVECDSRDDPDCASYPENAPYVATCTTFPNTQCYTQLNGGFTKRGCISKLTESERRSCLTGVADNCVACNDNTCNKEIFPPDRRRCHRCNSLDDPKCENAPTAPSVCPFYSEEEFCSTKVVDGATYRGCSSDFQCESSDYNYCRMCRGTDNCNTVDLLSLNNGYPGKWQGLPLNCYTCKGDECKNGPGAVGKCMGNDLQNCVTVFAEDGTISQRGCSNDVYENMEVSSYCDGHPDNCKFCKSHGCNTAANRNDFVDCIFCDGTENANCVLNVTDVKHRRSCHKKCMTGLYPRKDEPNPAYELSRGCLDDLDLDDREDCENGKNPLCKACEGGACNAVAIPDAPRLKCNTCNEANGGDCSKPESAECLAYRENDQCFALLDKDMQVNRPIRMGCASDLDNSDLFLHRRNLFLCNENNCNDRSNFPKNLACGDCNSELDPKCATNPMDISEPVNCDDIPYPHCYVRVDEGGVTRRGCLSKVSDDVFDDCLSGESGKCQICNEDWCNKKIFPENRRSCNRCDSNADPSCEDSPQQFASICPLYNESDSCVTKIEGSRTLRGCATEYTCDRTDSKKCRICSSDNCNNVNLLSSYVGEPGIWQDLPLNCNICDGEECVAGNEVVRKCEGNNLQTCMTVFGSDGRVQKRACSDAVEASRASYCEENPDKCLACKSNGCNNAKSLDDYTDCYFCDSAEGRNCSIGFDGKTRTRKCQGACMVALYPRSGSEDSAYETSRSCLDDMDLDDQEKCEAGKMQYCKACKGGKCNTMSVPDDEQRHECLKCTDEDCEDFESQKCNAFHPNDQCYILFDNQSSIAAMGCRSDFETNVVTELIKQKRMILCDGKNCNTPTIVQVKSCLICDSSDDPRCATNPNLIGSSDKCSALPYTECFTRVNEAGHTVRGCVASLPSEEFYGCLTNEDGLCETCSKDNCNSIDVFPADRLRCHQCDSTSNDKCESSPNTNQVCPMYDPQDSCVSNLRNGVTYRGCASNMKCSNEDDKRNCRTCKTPGCNTIDLVNVGADGEPGKWQDVPLTCVHCTDESDCESIGVFRVCQDNLFQNCMTVFNVAGKVVERGCNEKVEANNKQYCEENPDKCRRCNSNGCNIATSENDYVECLACDTDRNGACVTNVKAISSTRKCYKHCMTAMYPREHENNPAYHLARSCLDDLDMDDQEACLAGTKAYCKACDEAKCNTAEIPEKRLSCNMCSGENCQLPEQKSCPFYREGDQCYVLFDETHGISAMGCRSQYSNEEADFLFRQKRLFLCSDDNCNSVDNLPKTQTCTICSSRTDVACATNPDTLLANVRCNVAPFTECYSRVLADGSTERGCLSNLSDDEFVNCWSGNSSTCQACKGDTCNTKVFPEDRARCHICDSSFDPQCEYRPDNLGICPRYDPQESCLTVYRNGVTKRGCGSSLTCDGTGSRGCSTCTGNGCNTINLAKRQDDNYGKWQDLPLRCHVCNGTDECKNLSTEDVPTCENNNEQDCVVVFNKDGVVIQRGCEDDVEQAQGAYCDEHGDHCIHCKSNLCNVAQSLDEFNDCIYCDTHKDINCLWQPTNSTHLTRKCRSGCMTALYPSDSTSNPAYDLIRTCLDDKDSTDQTTCLSNRDANCKSCTGNNCNVDDLPENRLSCLYCASGDCEDPLPMKCPLYRQKDQCYIWFDSSNGVSEMGCVSSFRNQELESLIKTKRVYICDESENCNSLDKLVGSQKCATCDSKNDVLCAINAKAVGTFNQCNMMPYTSCYSKLSKDGTTSRGCLSDLVDDSFADCVLGKDTNCETCVGDACNREVYPADRQQCHTCTSLDDPDCESFPTHMQPCPIVSEKESCKTGLSGNETLRGCSSGIFCDANDSKTCRSCFGTSCNSIDLRNKVDDGYHGVWQDLPLKCHECIGEHCLASLGPVVTCKTNIEQDCMTVFESDGQSVRRRGCSDAVEDYEDLYCRLHPDLCFKCKSNECNVAWNTDEYVECAFCDSLENPACSTNPDSSDFAKRHCLKECMVALKNNDQLIRSCLDDIELYNQTDCGSDGKECASCSQGGCNNFVYPPDRLKCHVCTGTNCSGSKGEYCLKYDESDFCFAKYEGNRVDLMGCGSSQNKSDLEEWTQQNKLFKCAASDCNDLTKLPPVGGECFSCDSSKTPECAQNPKILDRFEQCAGLNSQCLTYIKDGHTIRSCASKLTEDEQTRCQGEGSCAICSGNKCNSEIFPTGRRQCHICNSLRDDKCDKSPNSLLVCPNYAPNDRCVAKHENNIVERGCQTDITCEVSNEKGCQICDTDGCNTREVSSSTAVKASLLFTIIVAFIATRWV